MASARRAGSLRRTVTNKAARREIVVFTEGLKTEIQYLSHWNRLYRGSVLVTFDDFHGAPLPLVQHAVDRRTADQRDERKGRGTAPAETWCIFDTDEHPSIPEALDLAVRNDILVAVSNPCLELWFLLHFQDQMAWIPRRAAQTATDRLLSPGKSLTSGDLAQLQERYSAARARAQALTVMHEVNGSPPSENPASNGWRLIDSIARSSNQPAETPVTPRPAGTAT